MQRNANLAAQSACRSECRWARQCGFKKPSKQASSPKACTTSTAMTTATLKVAAPCQRRTLQRPGRNQGWSSSCAAISGRGGEAEGLAVKVLLMVLFRRFTFACFTFAGKVLYAPWKKGSHAPYHKDDPSLQHEEQDEKKKLRCIICMASHAERSTLIRPTCTTICKTCDVPLHVGYCYEKYHDTNTCWFVDIDAKAIYRPHENCKPNSNKKTKRPSVGPPSAESFCGSSCTTRY